MQRAATKNTRAANPEERRFTAWIKEQPCCSCGNDGISIADHCEGATFRNNKVLVGHWFILPFCYECDKIKTFGSHNEQRERLGFTNAEMWCKVVENSGFEPPKEVYEAIKAWRR